MKINIEKKNFIWNFFGLTINSFNSLFLLIIVNRINGSNIAGIFTYAYSLICMVYYIGAFYSRTFQIKEMNDENCLDFIANRIISSLCMIIFTLIFLFITNYTLEKNFIIILVCIFRMLESLADVFYGIIQSKNLLYKAGLSMFIKGIIGIILFYFIDRFTNNLYYSILALCIVNLLFIITLDIPNALEYIKSKKINWNNVLYIFKRSIPIFFFQILNIYLINSSKYTLDFFEKPDIVNIFGIIMMPGTVMSLIGQYILNPYIVELASLFKEKKYMHFNKLINKIIVVLFCTGVFCSLIAYLIGISVLNFIYNVDLSLYRIQLCIIIISSIFIAIVAVFTCALTIFQKNNMQMLIYILLSMISLIMSIFLIRHYGIIGATISYSVSLLILVVIYFIYYRITINYIKGEK